MGGVVSAIFGGGNTTTVQAPTPVPQSQTDPYGAIGGRTQAATQLQGFMNNPSTALSSPGYQQQLQSGTQALQAASAASGTLQSGGQAAALQNFGQNTFSTYYQQMLNNLGTLSGATTQTPSSAAAVQSQSAIQSASLQQQINQQNASLGLGLTGMALGGANAAGLFSGGGGGALDSSALQSGGALDSLGGYFSAGESTGAPMDAALMAFMG